MTNQPTPQSAADLHTRQYIDHLRRIRRDQLVANLQRAKRDDVVATAQHWAEKTGSEMPDGRTASTSELIAFIVREHYPGLDSA